MEVLLLIALLAVIAALVVPALRRRREAVGAAPGVPLGPSRYGFVPTAQLDVRLPGPDQELVEALDEVQRDQDWQPAARLLALTDDWELRWQRVQSLAGAAAMELSQARRAGADADATAGRGGRDGGRAGRDAPETLGDPTGGDASVSFRKEAPAGVPDGRWLRRWRAERPNDAGGAEVYAQFLVWQAMADPDAADSRIVLEEAHKVCQEARAATTPEDPVPLITEILVARGLGYARSDFESLWATLRERAPHHMGAHLAALPYWSEKGQGSRKEAYAFAERAAADTRPGTLLSALPLFAVYDHLPDANLVRGLYQSAVVEQAIEGAQYAVQHAPADHPVLPHVRHLLLLFLVRAERYQEAMAEVRAVDGHVGAVPWVDGTDARAAYAAYRAMAVAGYEGNGGDSAALRPPPTSY